MKKKKRTFIKNNLGKLTIDEISQKTGLTKEEILAVSGSSIDEAHSSGEQKAAPFTHIAKRYIVPIGIILLFSFIVYSQSLKGEFIYDDIDIIGNEAIQINKLSQLVTLFFPYNADTISRKVGTASFALNYYFNGLNPFGYHLVNVLIHSFTGVVLFLFILITLTQFSSDDSLRSRAPVIALAGALLWLVHPVQTQAVSYITQRFASMCSLFYLLTLLLYVHARLSQGYKRFVLFLLSLFSAFLALGTKEIAATLPVVALLYEIFFFKKMTLTFNRKSVIFIAVMSAAFIGISVFFLQSEPVEILKQHYINRGLTPFERLMTEARIVVYYISLLIFPHPSRLRLIYDFSVSQSLFSPFTTFISVVIITSVLVIALVRARENKFLSFSLLWFFVNLAIESTVIPLDLAYEHRLYLPSMAPVALFVGLVLSVGVSQWKNVSYCVLAIVIVVFSYWSFERNKVWHDAVTLWEDNAKNSPNHAMVRGNLGRAYMDAGQYEKARTETEKALELDPHLRGAYYNLSIAYMEYYKDYEKAEKYLREILKRNRNDSLALLNIGVLYDRKKNFHQASLKFKEYIKWNKDDPQGYYNLATSYFNMKEYDKALSVLRKALQRWPSTHYFHSLSGRVYYSKGDLKSAQREFLTTLSLDENNGEAKRYLIKIAEKTFPSGK